jgi:hypothetical protein
MRRLQLKERWLPVEFLSTIGELLQQHGLADSAQTGFFPETWLITRTL